MHVLLPDVSVRSAPLARGAVCSSCLRSSRVAHPPPSAHDLPPLASPPSRPATRPRSFALLCKVGRPSLAPDGRSVVLRRPDLLEEAATRVCRHLLAFFVDVEAGVLRPYANSNLLLDFHRHVDSPYYAAVVDYLRRRGDGGGGVVPDYARQREGVALLYSFVRNLHGYDRFRLGGAMASTPNSKALQRVRSTEGAAPKLGRGHYYKYRAENLMFGCNAGAMWGLQSFAEFNSWRKNQLLMFYDTVRERVSGLAGRLREGGLTKYRDYCESLLGTY